MIMFGIFLKNVIDIRSKQAHNREEMWDRSNTEKRSETLASAARTFDPATSTFGRGGEFYDANSSV